MTTPANPLPAATATEPATTPPPDDSSGNRCARCRGPLPPKTTLVCPACWQMMPQSLHLEFKQATSTKGRDAVRHKVKLICRQFRRAELNQQNHKGRLSPERPEC
jgi:hypothetical protein